MDSGDAPKALMGLLSLVVCWQPLPSLEDSSDPPLSAVQNTVGLTSPTLKLWCLHNQAPPPVHIVDTQRVGFTHSVHIYSWHSYYKHFLKSVKQKKHFHAQLTYLKMNEFGPQNSEFFSQWGKVRQLSQI